MDQVCSCSNNPLAMCTSSRVLLAVRSVHLMHVTRCTVCAQGVDVDRRMLDFLVGLDTEFSDLVDGSHLYYPGDVSLQVGCAPSCAIYWMYAC